MLDYIERLTAWLREHGASFDGIEIRSMERGERGVFAARDLKAREILWDIPSNLIISRDTAHEAEIGQRALSGATTLESGDSVYAAWLLDQVHNPASFWQPFFECLPRSFPHIPLFYTPSDLEWLEGSFIAKVVKEVRDAYASDYELLARTVAGFDRFTRDEFFWARVTLATRTFACDVKGVRLDCLVPLMDMMNHDRHFNVHWQCSPEEPHLRAGPPDDVPEDTELQVSYGTKSNRRYLLVYGFVMAGQDMDEAAVEVGIPPDVALAGAKRTILLGADEAARFRRFFIAEPLPERDNTLSQETIAFMRIAQASEPEFVELVRAGLRPSEIRPVSAANEARALRMLEAACEKSLGRFQNSIEEDDVILTRSDLSYNARNCVITRRGEKRVLRYFIDYARAVALILETHPERFDEIRPTLIGA